MSHFSVIIFGSMDKDAVVRGADRVAKIVNDGAIPSAIRWLWLGNYVEQIARCVPPWQLMVHMS